MPCGRRGSGAGRGRRRDLDRRPGLAALGRARRAGPARARRDVQGLAPKQLHPRAVPWYNATHRFGGGLAVVAAGLVLGQALVTAIGLMWVAHVLIDRAAGYTLRDRDGFMRR